MSTWEWCIIVYIMIANKLTVVYYSKYQQWCIIVYIMIANKLTVVYYSINQQWSIIVYINSGVL